jgi:hypothetical protein
MTKHTFLFIPLFTLILLTGCSKDRTISGFDAELFSKAQRKDGFVYYNFSTEYLETPEDAEHKSKYLRTKYNYLAATILDSNGLVIPGSIFPEGSLIVNEMSSIKGEPEKLAIMFKDAKNVYADKNGWVWSYLNADNTVIEPASRMGVSCIACHSKPGNIDMTLMSDYFFIGKQ